MSIRIISGEYRSRRIEMPKGAEIRPTQDKVRESVFNLIRDFNGKRVLELFAGSGAFGIEAISRGAEHVTFVDNDVRCTKTVLLNAEGLKIPSNLYNIIKANAFTLLPKLHASGERFDMVFIDPPYYKDMAKNCLITLDGCDIVNPVGLVIVEHFRADDLPEDLTTLTRVTERRYGNTLITIWRKK